MTTEPLELLLLAAEDRLHGTTYATLPAEARADLASMQAEVDLLRAQVEALGLLAQKAAEPHVS